MSGFKDMQNLRYRRIYCLVAALTQAELGYKIGFAPKTVSRFKTGIYTLGVEALFLFANG